MQDSSAAYYHAVMTQHQFPEQEQLKCPRCDSPNTKFCYYNNYNLSQPRHFCKSCRRYWTKGGTLRNIPIGGASRKSTKRSGSSNNSKKSRVIKNPDADPTRKTQDPSSTAASRRAVPNQGQDAEENQDMKVLDMGGSFSSLLESSMQLGGILNGSGLNPVQSGGIAQNFAQDGFPGHYSGRFAGSHEEADYWGGIGCSNSWPDLAINTNGSRFHQRKT